MMFGWPTFKIMCDTPYIRHPSSKMSAVTISSNFIKWQKENELKSFDEIEKWRERLQPPESL